MLRTLSLSSVILLGGFGIALAADPPGSTPSAPPVPDPSPPSSLPTPTPLPDPTHLTIGRHAPPPPPDDFSAASDSAVDAIIGVILLPPDPPPGQSFAAELPDGDTLADNGETLDCTFTNDLIAVCDIMVCLSDGFCFDTGDDKCYDANGEVIPCP